MIKLIDAEDLMTEMNDFHDQPNIDINHVTFTGKELLLPEGVSMKRD